MTLADPHKQQYYGVELSWGYTDHPPLVDVDDSIEYLRLTDNNSDVTINGETFTAAPEMEIDIGRQSGSLDESATEIDFLRDNINDEMTAGTPHALIHVTIYEFVNGDSGDQTLIAYKGFVYRTLRNASGQEGTDRFICYTDKKAYDRALGVPADAQCIWSLFGKGCTNYHAEGGGGPLRDSFTSKVDLDTIDGRTVDLGDVSVDATGLGPLWQDGYIEVRGLRIKIRTWDEVQSAGSGPGLYDITVELVEEPPASWASAGPSRLVAGCSKTVERCGTSYSNTTNWCGPGYGILPYNPIVEDKPS